MCNIYYLILVYLNNINYYIRSPVPVRIIAPHPLFFLYSHFARLRTWSMPSPEHFDETDVHFCQAYPTEPTFQTSSWVIEETPDEPGRSIAASVAGCIAHGPSLFAGLTVAGRLSWWNIRGHPVSRLLEFYIYTKFFSLFSTPGALQECTRWRTEMQIRCRRSSLSERTPSTWAFIDFRTTLHVECIRENETGHEVNWWRACKARSWRKEQ